MDYAPVAQSHQARLIPLVLFAGRPLMLMAVQSAASCYIENKMEPLIQREMHQATSSPPDSRDCFLYMPVCSAWQAIQPLVEHHAMQRPHSRKDEAQLQPNAGIKQTNPGGPDTRGGIAFMQ